MEELVIRTEQIEDVLGIHQLTRSAFLDEAHSSNTEHYIVDALREAGALYISLVAELDGKIIGHVAISPVTISDHSVGWYGLGPISVSPEYQKQGIGSLLMRDVLAQLADRLASGCVLLGNPDYYQRFGFAAIEGLILPNVPTQYFQAISFCDSFASGTVEYHSAFSKNA